MDKNTSKFFTVALYLFIAALLIAGYFLTHHRPIKPESSSVREEAVEQGSLKPIGVNMKNIATHILTKDDGSVVLIDRNGFDLDQYTSEKRVEVRGYYEKNQNGKDILKVENISAVNAPEIQKEEKKPVSFDIYKSGNLGIMLKYRKDWIIENDAKILRFKLPVADEKSEGIGEQTAGAKSKDSQTQISGENSKNAQGQTYEAKSNAGAEQKFDIIAIELLPNSKKQTLDEYVASFNDSTIQKSKIGLDGTPSYKRTLGSKVIFYADRESKFIYRISYNPAVSKLFDPNRNIFYEIV